MISFFRKIRQKLLQDLPAGKVGNRVTRYLAYAIGEIVLVVIGILIALQVNNWNEGRKNRERTNLLLESLQNELYSDYKKLGYFLEWNQRTDSIFKTVFDSLPFQANWDEERSKILLSLGRSYYPVPLQERTYQELKEKKETVPSDYDELLRRLDIYFNETIVPHHTLEERINNHLENFSIFGFSLPYFKDWLERVPSSELIKFIKEDEQYHKFLYRYRNILEDHRTVIFYIRNQILLQYFSIQNKLGNQNESKDFDLSLFYSSEELTEYEGTYETRAAESELIFTSEGNLLLGRTMNAREEYIEYYIIEKIGTDSIRRAGFPDEYNVFIRDDKEQVVGLDTYVEGIKAFSGLKLEK